MAGAREVAGAAVVKTAKTLATHMKKKLMEESLMASMISRLTMVKSLRMAPKLRPLSQARNQKSQIVLMTLRNKPFRK